MPTMAGMRRRPTVLFSLVLFISVPAAAKPKGSWEDVMRLAPGTRISVKNFRFWPASRCDFLWADDRRLACTPAHAELLPLMPVIPLPFPDRPLIFVRGEVLRVRLEHGDDANALMGAAVGGGAFAALGAANADPGCHPSCRGANAVILGIFGAYFGSFWGQVFPILHRKVIYHR